MAASISWLWHCISVHPVCLLQCPHQPFLLRPWVGLHREPGMRKMDGTSGQRSPLSFGNSWTQGVDRCGCCWGAFGEKVRAHFRFSSAPYPGLKLKVCQMGQGICIGGTLVACGASAALYVSRESTESCGRGTLSLVPINHLQPW